MPSLLKLIRQTSVRRFVSDAAGGILPLFAISLIVLMGFAALAIDYSRAMNVRGKLDNAADAAALAAVTEAGRLSSSDPSMGEETIATKAEQFASGVMRAHVGGKKIDASSLAFDVKVKRMSSEWKTELTYSANMQLSVGAIFGDNQMAISGIAKAAVRPSFPVLDIAMCVDSTGSMTPTIDAVKSNALNFFDNLNAEMKQRNMPEFPLVRVRAIFFKDFGDEVPGVWDPDPIRDSGFLSLPSQSSDFKSFVDPQLAGGGADWPESDLECLNAAMSSKWTKVGEIPVGYSERVTDVYPVIAMWTDSPSHPVGYPNSIANPAYPPASEMPRTFTDFRAKWDNPSVIDQTNKQILFFGEILNDPGFQGGYDSGWVEVSKWPKFSIAGTLLEGNISMVEFLAEGISRAAKGVRITN